MSDSADYVLAAARYPFRMGASVLVHTLDAQDP
jgi:hypothetical protein